MAGSLANATSTRVDSASKHIIPCRVSTDYMVSLVGSSVDNAARELQTNKMKYCMHKDDMVIGLGRAMYGTSINSSKKRAYPSVIVTLASMDDLVRNFIAMQNFMVKGPTCTALCKAAFVSALGEGDAEMDEDEYSIESKDLCSDRVRARRAQSQVENLLDFYFVGVSLGLAYAHPHSGDTVASVMIGGLRTVLNGDFQVHTNDLLMFYWDSELGLFEESGGRRKRGSLATSAQKGKFLKSGRVEDEEFAVVHGRSDIERRGYYARGNGTYSGGVGGPVQGKVNVARIKPYITSRHATEGRTEHFPMDKARVFGKAISNAQPFEMVDIMLSRQAI